MTLKVNVKHTLTWEETTPGEWRLLTFGALCEIADKGRDEGINRNCFVYFHPEYVDDSRPLRADRVLIDSEGL